VEALRGVVKRAINRSHNLATQAICLLRSSNREKVMGSFADIGLQPSDEQRFLSRAEFSRMKLAELTKRLRTAKRTDAFLKLTIYSAGSYGRLEASEHSDIDLFFVLANPRESYEEIRVPEIRLLSELVEIGYMMSFPKFSNDGHFLKLLFLNDILDNLGSPADDYYNHFTARMLLLLESKPVYGPDIYNYLLDETVASYFRDYEHHPSDFRPTFLINDIIRFWKTLCLNYEHKRNEQEKRAQVKHKIKNFKLGFSRLLTCFATVAILSTYRETVSPEDVVSICKMTPAERLISLARQKPVLTASVKEALELYSWFLSMTALPTAELEEYFSDKARRADAFAKARNFGDKIFSILQLADESNRSLRYMVV
jgi:predicted nucleotidyltransferase